MEAADDDNQAPAELCPTCGSAMVTEDGETFCPKCAAEINWGMDDDEDSDT